MAQEPIRFNDGAAYERGMAPWSQLAGVEFLDWLSPAPGMRWMDIGCGNGAFTELIVQRCAPAATVGIDPSDAQLAFARTRPGAAGAIFQTGDAMALQFEAASFDVAVMALVIFFVPEPAKGVAEMARVLRPGGTAAAYAWDMEGGGFPFEPVLAELRATGASTPAPPSGGIERLDRLRDLWTDAGFKGVQTRVISVRRVFPDFESAWQASTGMGSMRPTLEAMAPAALDQLKNRVRARMTIDANGAVSWEARANAITGRLIG